MFAPTHPTLRLFHVKHLWSLISLSLLLHLPKLDETISCKHRDLQEPLKLQGCIPIHGRDLLEPIQDRTSEFYKMFLLSENELRLAEGIILNTFMDLEENAIKALLEEDKNLTLSNWTYRSNWFNFKQLG